MYLSCKLHLINGVVDEQDDLSFGRLCTNLYIYGRGRFGKSPHFLLDFFFETFPYKKSDATIITKPLQCRAVSMDIDFKLKFQPQPQP